MDSETVSATEFKAKCLDFLDRVSARQINCLEITKRGKPVAVLIPPASRREALERLHGFLRGSVMVPEAVDLTAPVLDEPSNAEAGEFGNWCWRQARGVHGDPAADRHSPSPRHPHRHPRRKDRRLRRAGPRPGRAVLT